MNWWPFKKPKPPAIPAYKPAEPKKVLIEPKVVAKVEPGIEVEENLDPSDSMILRIVKAIKERY